MSSIRAKRLDAILKITLQLNCLTPILLGLVTIKRLKSILSYLTVYAQKERRFQPKADGANHARTCCVSKNFRTPLRMARANFNW